MKTLLILLSMMLLAGCPPQNTTQPSAEPTSFPTIKPPVPTPLPSVSLAPTAQIQQILTTTQLTLKVNEELMLIGDVVLNNGTKVSFDSVKNLLEVQNQNPALLSLDLNNRLVKGLQAGTATVLVSAKGNPAAQVLVTIQIEAVTASLDPNVALVDVEIE